MNGPRSDPGAIHHQAFSATFAFLPLGLASPSNRWAISFGTIINISLVDVRAPAEFSGELLAPENLPQEGAQRGGHIPGAANIPWAQAANEDGTFKSADELQQLYGDKGIDGSKETIAYCRIGERSSHTWFVLTQLLGHSNVRNYDGSWTEWGSIVGAPIEK